MTNNERRDEYLAKAKDAEKRAGNAKSEKAAEAWYRIAASYRDLAMMAQIAQRPRRVRPKR